MSVCAECGDKWGGQRAAHCAYCHQTFSTDANYHRHLVIDRGPGVYKVVGHQNPATVVDRHGNRLLFQKVKADGTSIWSGPSSTPDDIVGTVFADWQIW